MSRLFAALLLAAVAVQASLASSATSSAGRLRLGASKKIAKPGQFPHQAWLQVTTTKLKTRRCAGALISPEWVITSASCVKDSIDVEVQLGTFYVPMASEDYYIHYSFSSKKIVSEVFDLALIRLLKIVSTDKNDDYVAPIRLPPLSYANASHFLWKTTVSEYAMVNPDDEFSSWNLLYSSARVEPNFLCRLQNKSFSGDNLCLFSWWHKKGTCSRDVGSPLIVTESDGKPTLLGLATSVDGTTSSCGTVFTKIAPHLDWISTQTGIALRD